MPDARSITIAASNARFAKRRGTEAMLVRRRWQTDRVPERDLLVLSEEPLNAETRLDPKTPAIPPAGRHSVRTPFRIPTGPRPIAIAGLGGPASISSASPRSLPRRSMVWRFVGAGFAGG